MAPAPDRNRTRERLAHLAARLMAQDGIEDYALAKRKAARQAGLTAAHQMPNNDEIDAALKLYRGLYRHEHTSQLHWLRQLALQLMDELARYDPHLTGSVLRGSAGKYAGIYLQLFTDNTKSVEHYLLGRGIGFRPGETQLYAGDMSFNAPTLSFERAGVDIHLTMLTPRDLRSRIKASAGGKPIERAKRDVVAAMLAADS